MENQIIQELGKTLQSLLPSIQQEVKSLKDFAIFSGATLKMKAPPELKELVDARSWYITMKFDGTATREDAKRVFEIAMVDRLGLPRTNQNLDDEILPRQEYGTSSDAPQLPAPPSGDTIDIDDEGNIKQDIVQKTPLAVSPVSRYYAVEFKIFSIPKPAGYLGNPTSGYLGHKAKKCWSPKHLGMY